MVGVDPEGSILAEPENLNKTNVTYYDVEVNMKRNVKHTFETVSLLHLFDDVRSIKVDIKSHFSLEKHIRKGYNSSLLSHH